MAIGIIVIKLIFVLFLFLHSFPVWVQQHPFRRHFFLFLLQSQVFCLHFIDNGQQSICQTLTATVGPLWMQYNTFENLNFNGNRYRNPSHSGASALRFSLSFSVRVVWLRVVGIGDTKPSHHTHTSTQMLSFPTFDLVRCAQLPIHHKTNDKLKCFSVSSN